MKPMIFLSAALLAASSPALADTVTEHQFELDGTTYIYTVADQGDRHILSGRYYPSGVRFRLTVEDGRVYGRMNGRPVRFDVSEAADISSAETEIASR